MAAPLGYEEHTATHAAGFTNLVSTTNNILLTTTVDAAFFTKITVVAIIAVFALIAFIRWLSREKIND